MIGDNLEKYTYDYLMRLAMSYVPDDRDKREGSVIYDAIAPCCQVLAAGVLELRNFYTQTYATTATGVDLENRAAEQGITRYPATHAIKRIDLADASGNPVIVPIGSRFSTISETSPINYAVTANYYDKEGKIVPGSYAATCEEAGIVGNQYSGNLVNITFIQGLASAYMSTTIEPARDEETDEELRERYFAALNHKSFGGNISDYRTKVKEEFPGVGDLQIYPVWNGGGTVKLSIVDASYGKCEPEYVATVQNKIDPEVEGQRGTGLGIAPIGHIVTIDTPDEVDIEVTATVAFDGNYKSEQVAPYIVDALKSYIQSLRESWADSDDMNKYSCELFVSKVTSYIIDVLGVSNVTDVLLNGEAKDIELTQNGDIQQLPKLSKVILNGGVVFDVQQTA